MKKLSLVLAVGALVGNAWGADLTLKDVQAKLGANKGSWKAAENWVTKLSPAERRQMLGAKLSKNFGTMRFISRKPRRTDLPASIDWRNKDGVNYASPILNQGRCGSCVAFGTIGTLETQTNITRNTPYSPWAFSTQYLFACGGATCDTGWEPDSAVSFLKNTGVPDEACFPNTEGALGTDAACTAACSDAASRSLKITGSATPTSGMRAPDDVKAALLKGPLITTLTVYTDFFFYQSGVYKHTTGQLEGGHAVSIVGYNDADQAWIVRNSWGPDWGQNGYIEVAYTDDSGVADETWGLEVPQADGFVTLGSLRDHAVLKGTVDLGIQSTYHSTDSVEWTLTHNATGTIKAWGGRTDNLDTTQYPDGVYTLTAIAHHGGATDKSQPRIVYLLNGTLTGSLQFTNITAGQSIAAQTFVMEMSTTSSPIPFSTVTFHSKSVSTGQTWDKSTVNVADKMAMSWRTQDPAGDYDVWLEGSAGGQTITSAPIRVTVTD